MKSSGSIIFSGSILIKFCQETLKIVQSAELSPKVSIKSVQTSHKSHKNVNNLKFYAFIKYCSIIFDYKKLAA